MRQKILSNDTDSSPYLPLRVRTVTAIRANTTQQHTVKDWRRAGNPCRPTPLLAQKVPTCISCIHKISTQRVQTANVSQKHFQGFFQSSLYYHAIVYRYYISRSGFPAACAYPSWILTYVLPILGSILCRSPLKFNRLSIV